jgi:hypothetical protein
MITALATAALAVVTTILVFVAARQLPALYRAAESSAEAAKLQAKTLRIETDPLIVLEPMPQDAGTREDISGWYFVRTKDGGAVTDGLELSDYIAAARSEGGLVFAPWDSVYGRPFTVVKIKNLGRSAAINARVEIQIKWGVVVVVPGDPPDIRATGRKATAIVRIPSVAQLGYVCMGFANMIGLQVTLIATGAASDEGMQTETRSFSAATPQPIVLLPRD